MDYLERNRDFKGVWIPKEIWLNDQLTMLEKVILTEIDSLDNEEHCMAGNEYLAQFCQCSEWKVSTAVKKLIELGYIEVVSFDGRHRRLKSCLWKSQKQTLENPKADSGKPKAININSNIDNNSFIYNGETSSPSVFEANNESTDNESKSDGEVVEPSTPPQEKPKRQSRKDQLTEFIQSLNYCEETKQELLKWLFQIGLNGNVTIDQLKEKLAYIHNIYNDESLVRQSIKNAYLNNWFGFFPVKVNKPAPHLQPAQTRTTPSTPLKQAEYTVLTPELLNKYFPKKN